MRPSAGRSRPWKSGPRKPRGASYGTQFSVHCAPEPLPNHQLRLEFVSVQAENHHSHRGPVSLGGTKLPTERAGSLDATWREVPLPAPVCPQGEGPLGASPASQGTVGHLQGLWADVCRGLALGLRSGLDVCEGPRMVAVASGAPRWQRPRGWLPHVTLAQGRGLVLEQARPSPGAPSTQGDRLWLKRPHVCPRACTGVLGPQPPHGHEAE